MEAKKGYGLTEAIQPPISGPRRIGQIGAIAAGYYTDIFEVLAPASAKYGDTVEVEASVENIYDVAIYIAATGRYDGVDIFPTPEYLRLEPYTYYPFRFSFTMPNHDVRVDIWSFYWTGSEWYQDDYRYVDIALEVVAPPVAGTISRMELEYDEARASIPAYDIPQGKRGLVHIWGRNDTNVNQKMGIHWGVADPDQVIIEEYADWETFSTGPGEEHEFIGGRFNLDKVGTYGLVVGLFMNPDAPEQVDYYYGYLGSVAALVPEPTFAGFGITEYTKR